MAVYNPGPRVVRAMVYIEMADGQKTVYDMNNIADGVTIDWRREYSFGAIDMSFAFAGIIGESTQYTPDFFTPPPPPPEPKAVER